MNYQASGGGGFGIIAVAPHSGVTLEIGGAVAGSVGVVPEADRHRGKRLRADQFALLARDRGAGVVPDLGRHAERRALQLPAPHGKGRVAERETTDDVGAAGDRSHAEVAFHRVVYVIETGRGQRRPGGKHNPQLGQSVGVGGPQLRLRQRLDEPGRGSEMGHALGVGVVEQDIPVGVERRPVIEQQRRPGGESAQQPVPHHPPAGGEEEHPVARVDVAMQAVFAQMLEQHAAGAVHYALGRAGGPGGEQDRQRVVERQAVEFDLAGGERGEPFVPGRRAVGRRFRLVVSGNDDAGAAGKSGGDVGQPRARIVTLAVVAVAVATDQNLRRDLPETVEDRRGAEIGRA